MTQEKPGNKTHTDKCRCLIERLQICDLIFGEKITNKYHLDYFGWNSKTKVIIEYKPTAKEIPGAIVQLLGYYHELKRDKFFKRGFHRSEAKLIIYYDGHEISKFNKAIALYREYIENPNCPQIFFVCHGENDKLEIT
jgi:hypothetical protein